MQLCAPQHSTQLCFHVVVTLFTICKVLCCRNQFHMYWTSHGLLKIQLIATWISANVINGNRFRGAELRKTERNNVHLTALHMQLTHAPVSKAQFQCIFSKTVPSLFICCKAQQHGRGFLNTDVNNFQLNWQLVLHLKCLLIHVE